MKTVQTEIPDKLYKEAESLVREGWFRDEGELLEKFIRDDVEWGLHGND
jgi:hypothetical protein